MSVRIGEGSVLLGRYRLGRLLGEGGMGRVFLARREGLGGHVAIKILREDVELPPNAVERLRREAQSASRITSESVVRILDLQTTESGSPFIVMEYVAGTTMSAYLAEHGPMPTTRAADVVIDIATVLAEAHARGIVHRDIKASNIALTKRADGTELVKVLDFGIAKQTAASVSSLTETVAVLGSPKYMSPEQIRDARNVGPSGDLWSLSVLLYELVTGAAPFEALTVPGLFAKIVADPPRPPREVRADLPVALEELLLKALAKEPSDRHRDAAELAEALAPLATEDGARRAARVRAIYTHARTEALSEPPAAPAVPASDASLTSAATEIERPPPRPRASSGPRLRNAALLVGALGVLGVGAAWKTRAASPAPAPSPPDEPARSAVAARESPPPLVAPPAASSDTDASVSAATSAVSSARPAAPRVSAAPPKPVVSAATKLPPRSEDEDFGPRQ
ncbi:MAG: serine/threonine-protein kinase [Labilithrix sp.]